MTTLVTAAMLYDLVACPHRVTMDIFADPAQRDKGRPRNLASDIGEVRMTGMKQLSCRTNPRIVQQLKCSTSNSAWPKSGRFRKIAYA